jgi:hypothetical protein
MAIPAAIKNALIERSGGMCEAQLDGCNGRAIDPHHRKNSKNGGRKGAAKTAHDVLSNLLDLCRSCHEQVTSTHGERRRFALDTGLICLEHEDPAEVPVTIARYGPVLLSDEGGVWPADLQPINPKGEWPDGD